MTSSRLSVTLGGSLDEPSAQWLSGVVNSAAESATLTSYAIAPPDFDPPLAPRSLTGYSARCGVRRAASWVLERTPSFA